MKNRAEDYLRKPFAIQTLLDKVRPLVGDFEGEAPSGLHVAMDDDVEVEVNGRRRFDVKDRQFAQTVAIFLLGARIKFAGQFVPACGVQL